MAASEDDINRGEQERNNLQRTAADLETAIAVSNPGARRLLELSLAGVKARVATLDKRIEEAKVEHAAEVQTRIAAAAALAAKETKLNAEERATYRSFLEQAYFTKKDFGKLDTFYQHSYDRLSEDGKEQMSKRIDEGIRQGEFKFSDLPKNALEKETEHRAARARKEAATREDGDKGNDAGQSLKAAAKTAIKDIDLSSVDLSGIKLGDAAASPNTASLPNDVGPRVNSRGTGTRSS